jgi:hypothetical protein
MIRKNYSTRLIRAPLAPSNEPAKHQIFGIAALEKIPNK